MLEQTLHLLTELLLKALSGLGRRARNQNFKLGQSLQIQLEVFRCLMSWAMFKVKLRRRCSVLTDLPIAETFIAAALILTFIRTVRPGLLIRRRRNSTLC